MKELDADEFRRLGHLAIELAAEHMFGMRERPVFTPMTLAERLAISNAELPAAGLAPQRVLDFMRDRIMPHPMGNGHPRYFGWSTPAPSSMGVLAELLAAAMNPSGEGGDHHAAMHVERCALRWLMELIGFPVQGSQGALVSGSVMAALTCLSVARQHVLQCAGLSLRGAETADEPALVVYMSDQGHSSLLKAVELVGFGKILVRIVPTFPDYRMDVDALRAAIARDREAGRQPLCVSASAGTMNTGAIDPLRAVANLCAAESVWFHIDATLGGLAVLDGSLPELAALAVADSVTLAPHKWLGVPAECSVLLVREGHLLRDAAAGAPLQHSDSYVGLSAVTRTPDAGAGGQFSQDFRALKLWATLLHLGRDGIRSRVQQHRALARALAQRVEAEPALELLAQPELSIVCLRYIAISDPSEERLRSFNRALISQVQAEGDVFLTGTDLKAGFALRVSIMHHSTRGSDVAVMLQTLLKAAARLNEAGFHVGRAIAR